MLIDLTAKIVALLRPGLAKKITKMVLKEEFFWIDKIYNPFVERSCKRLILELPGRGCAWYKVSGGCTMCGFNRKLEEVNRRWKFSSADLLGFFKIADSLSGHEKPELLYIYNGGSFLNENEIPLETQLGIARRVEAHSNLRVLFVESRPEFVTEVRLLRLLNVIGQKKLEVGIGLETVSNKVREKYIHKGFTLLDYERATSVIKNHGVALLVYVFLKPLGLSEGKAIEEAVSTIKYAFETGSDEVSLSCAFVQEGTEMAEKYEQGEFRPPWLWSIIEVVRRTAHLGPVRVGSFKDEPLPIAIPHNCLVCSRKVEEALQKYNLARNIAIFDGLDCECRALWREEIKKA